MIVRGALRCEVCGQAHIVRIGMGQEERQRHRFRCRGCDEVIEVGLNVDYQKISANIHFGENALEMQEPVDGAAILNLDANFPIPAELQGKDGVFPRLLLQRKIFDHVIARREARGLPGLPSAPIDVEVEAFPPRPDFAAEWTELRRVWGWIEAKNMQLASEYVLRASEGRYSGDPLSGQDVVEKANDWLWRFLSKVAQPEYQDGFEAALQAIDESEKPEILRMMKEYYGPRVEERSAIYNLILKDFFKNYDEFSQVLLLVRTGVKIDFEIESTLNFEEVGMFYGNAYEALGSLVDILALINNAIKRRKFDSFERLTLDGYASLDKPARFGPFSENDRFSVFLSEKDNGLRNASHHRRFMYRKRDGKLIYRKGNAGKGEYVEISYGSYLERCCRIFCVILTLLRFEMVLCKSVGQKNLIHINPA